MSGRGEFDRGDQRKKKKKGMEIGIADWQTKLKFNSYQNRCSVEKEEKKNREKKGRSVGGMKIRTDGDGGSGEAVVVGGGGMRGEGGWREREKERVRVEESRNRPSVVPDRSLPFFPRSSSTRVIH